MLGLTEKQHHTLNIIKDLLSRGDILNYGF